MVRVGVRVRVGPAMAKPTPWVDPVTKTTRPFMRRSPVVRGILDQKLRLSNAGNALAKRGCVTRPGARCAAALPASVAWPRNMCRSRHSSGPALGGVSSVITGAPALR